MNCEHGKALFGDIPEEISKRLINLYAKSLHLFIHYLQKLSSEASLGMGGGEREGEDRHHT